MEAGAGQRSDEPLEADRRAGRQAVDGLVDGAQQAPVGDRRHGRRQLRRRPRVAGGPVALRVEDLDVGPAMSLAPVERGVGLPEELAAVAGLRDQAGDAARERELGHGPFVGGLDRRARSRRAMAKAAIESV